MHEHVGLVVLEARVGVHHRGVEGGDLAGDVVGLVRELVWTIGTSVEIEIFGQVELGVKLRIGKEVFIEALAALFLRKLGSLHLLGRRQHGQLTHADRAVPEGLCCALLWDVVGLVDEPQLRLRHRSLVAILLWLELACLKVRPVGDALLGSRELRGPTEESLRLLGVVRCVSNRSACILLNHQRSFCCLVLHVAEILGLPGRKLGAPLWALAVLLAEGNEFLAHELGDGIKAFYIGLEEVVLVLDAVFNQVLKLLHLNFDNDLVDLGLVHRLGLFLAGVLARRGLL